MISIVQNIVFIIVGIFGCVGILLAIKASRKGDYEKGMTWAFFGVASSSFGILIYFILELYSLVGGK